MFVDDLQVLIVAVGCSVGVSVPAEYILYDKVGLTECTYDVYQKYITIIAVVLRPRNNKVDVRRAFRTIFNAYLKCEK